MATENKKLVRSCVQQWEDKSTDELLARFAEPMNETEFSALKKILKTRRVRIPTHHGEVTEDPTANVQRVIQIEELANVEIGRDQRKPGMGWLESVSVVAGIVVAVLLWQRSVWVSVSLGVLTGLAVYAGGAFARMFWREMGTRRGTLDMPQPPRARQKGPHR